MTVTSAGRNASFTSNEQLPEKARKRSGCGRTLGCGCLLLILLLLLVGGGGYVALRTGAISPWQVYGLTQPKPVTIHLANLRDDMLYVSVTYLDSEGESVYRQSLDLGAFDVRVTYLQQAGRYRIEFGRQSRGSDLGVCNLNAASGERYQFVALPDKIVVNRANKPSQVGTDYVLSTCSFCR